MAAKSWLREAARSGMSRRPRDLGARRWSRWCWGRRRCRHCRRGHENSCAERVFLGDAGLNGGYAELVCVDADAALPVPAGVTADEAGIVACTTGTGLNAVPDGGQVQQPLEPTFFAASFGMLTDRFGLMWMVLAPKAA